MKPIQIKFTLVAGLLVFMFGCSTIKVVSTDQTPDFSLKSYQTFNFYDIEVEADSLSFFYHRIGLLEDEIENQLELKGLKQADENPDLLINLGIVMWESVQTTESNLANSEPRYVGGGNYVWEREELAIGTYNEGTMVVHLVDTKSNILVWKGIVDGVVVKKDKSAQKNVRIGMEHLFKEMK